MSETKSPTPLKNGDICTVLFDRQVKDTWHWTICIPSNKTTFGVTKFHATQPPDDPSRWFFESKPNSLETSLTACVAVRIGTLKTEGDHERFGKLLKDIPMSIPQEDIGVESRFTCRVWWKQAIRLLISNRFIECSDIHALEEECKEFARTNNRFEGNEYYQYYTSQTSS